jgi:uncharacterized membrane protein
LADPTSTARVKALDLFSEMIMLASFLMGLVGGQRAMTPLAVVAIAAARDELPADNGAPKLLSHPVVAAGALALAIGEMAGDKQKTAPDRIVAIGLAARFVTSAIAGASLVPRRQRWLGGGVLSRLACAYGGDVAVRSDTDRVRRGCGSSGGRGGDCAQRRETWGCLTSEAYSGRAEKLPCRGDDPYLTLYARLRVDFVW